MTTVCVLSLRWLIVRSHNEYNTPITHTYTHTHTYAHTHTYTHIHTYTHLVVCAHLHVRGYTILCLFACLFAYKPLPLLHARTALAFGLLRIKTAELQTTSRHRLSGSTGSSAGKTPVSVSDIRVYTHTHTHIHTRTRAQTHTYITQSAEFMYP